MSDIKCVPKFSDRSLDIIVNYLDLSELCNAIPNTIKSKKNILLNVILKKLNTLKKKLIVNILFIENIIIAKYMILCLYS